MGLHVATTPRGSTWMMGAFAERTRLDSSALDSSSRIASWMSKHAPYQMVWPLGCRCGCELQRIHL